MGGNVSKAKPVSSSIMDAIAESVTNNIMDCKTNSTVVQDINFTGNNMKISGNTIQQIYVLDASCVQDANTIDKIQQDAINAAKNEITSKTSAVAFLNKSEASPTTIVETHIRTTLTKNNITTAINQTNAIQKLNISGNNIEFTGNAMTQSSKVLFTNMQKLINNTQVAQALDNQLVAKASSTTGGMFDFLDFLGNSQIWLYIMIIAVCIMVAVGMFEYYTQGGGNRDRGRRGDW